MPTIERLVDISEAAAEFAELIAEVGRGVEVTITRDNAPVARIVAAAPAQGPRIAGLNPGSIRTTDDFDAPLPDSFWVGGT
jgi:prevent-host-death family protein